MTSVTAFNDMLDHFLSELVLTFPEETAIKSQHTKFELMRKSNPRKCVDLFMAGTAPISDRLMQKDETLISDAAIPAISEFHIETHWPTCSDNTKNVVWQYVTTLYMLGVTITSLPADTLSMIEDVAIKAAGSMGGGDQNPEALMKMFGNLLK
jgi:hypothetical protein